VVLLRSSRVLDISYAYDIHYAFLYANFCVLSITVIRTVRSQLHVASYHTAMVSVAGDAINSRVSVLCRRHIVLLCVLQFRSVPRVSIWFVFRYFRFLPLASGVQLTEVYSTRGSFILKLANRMCIVCVHHPPALSIRWRFEMRILLVSYPPNIWCMVRMSFDTWFVSAVFFGVTCENMPQCVYCLSIFSRMAVCFFLAC